MLKNHYPVFYYPMGFANQESDLFKRKMRMKLKIIQDVVSYGYDVLYMDSDVILLKDPFPYLYSITGYDLIAQQDETICSGFMYLKSSKKSIALMSTAYRIVQQPEMDDRTALIKAANECSVPYYLLPTGLFPSGSDYFEKYQYYWDKRGKRCCCLFIKR